ncbi:hypothetical protein BWR19_08985 [Halomonas sp. 1513]|nr:DUF3306 domain-containing protein [Halomonas sp. 1513]APX93050.1 hypothetical protein BWR19_08985 [Halomonas sp. 1513]
MNRFELWSRRKRGLAVEQDGIEEAEPADQAAPDSQATLDDAAAEQGRHPEGGEDAPAGPPPEGSLDHTLPDPDTLGPGSDFKAYLVPGVSAALKNRALRRLWTTGNYHVRDGLDDYDLDYSQMRKMTAETSESVRQWGKKLFDKLEEPEAETAPEPTASTTSATSEHESAADARAAPEHREMPRDASEHRDTPAEEPSEKER